MKKSFFLFVLILSFYTSMGQDIALNKDTIYFTQVIRVRNNIVQASFAFFIINRKYYNGNNFPFGSVLCFDLDSSQLKPFQRYFALKKSIDNERNLEKIFRKLNRKKYYPLNEKGHKVTMSRFYNCTFDQYIDTGKTNDFYVRSIKFVGSYFFMYCDMRKDNLIPIFCPQILEGDKIPVILNIGKIIR